jgi:hypothetical protein
MSPKNSAPSPAEAVVKVNADDFKGMTTRDALAYWTALPAKVRNPATQKELAALLGVSEERLCQIKRDEAFKAQVMEYRKTFFRQFTSDIIESMVKAAKGGNERAAKLYLQYVEDFQESSKQTIEKTEVRRFVFELGEQKLQELRGELKKMKRLKEGEYVDAELIEEVKDDAEKESVEGN